MATGTQPGKAWVWSKSKKKWVKPKAPSGDFAWDDNQGWINQATAANSFAIPLSIINSDPELAKLFNEAWAAQKSGAEWTKEMFDVKLKATTWYGSKSEAQRNYYTLSNDPAQKVEFDKQIAASRASVEDLAAQIGASLTPEELDTWSRTVLQNGMNDAEIRNTLSGFISFKGKTDEEIIGSLTGVAGDTEDTLRKYAKDYGVTVSNSWILDQVKSVAAGNSKVDDAKKYFVDLAKQQYSQFADQIDENRSVDFLSSGYKQIVADELDKDYQSMDITNPHVQAAMTALDPTTGKAISMDSFRKTIRSSDDWGNVTKNKNKIMATGQALIGRMGMM